MLTLASVLMLQVVAADPPMISIAGHITGPSRTHTVRVALWDEAGLFKKPTQSLVLAPGAPLVFQFDVPAGQWAVSAFEDVNESGILEVGFFGPKEPTGFWRVFTAWRAPKFAEVSRVVDKPITDGEITFK